MMELKILSLALFTLIVCENVLGQEEFLEPCESKVYCQGSLLDTIQRNRLYVDDKTFVDLALKQSPEQVISNFEALGISGDVEGNPQLIKQLHDFVNENFENGTEFEEWIPTDWIDNPVFLKNISDPEFNQWAQELHGFWEQLGRKIKESVNASDRYSMHYVSHPVIVPGGRFKEFYYWDSYWIQKGLIVSEMTVTVRGMIENFVEMVQNLGYIPNGGRIYYERSQPPLFIPMVKNYYDATGNLTFIRNVMNIMEQEFKFFMENRTVTFVHSNGQSYTMARYNVDRKSPRPESYSKDYELVHPLNINDTEKDILYANLKAGAESGWDFSSRWFVLEGADIGEANLSHTKTRDIIPVDLNGFLYWNAIILQDFCQLIPDNCVENATYYENKAADWKKAIYDVLWDEEIGSWFDYDYIRGNLHREFYPTNIVPLWVKAHHDDTAVTKIMAYFKDVKATSFPAGVPSSMLQTGQQWDFPNGWAPLNHMVVEAFEYSGNQDAQDLAFDLAQRWTRTNHLAYLKHNKIMFEKYDVSCIGCAGGGGEYEVVVGFGWTNGVILDFLKMYGNRMSAHKDLDNGSPSVHIGAVTFLASLLSIIKFLTL